LSDFLEDPILLAQKVQNTGDKCGKKKSTNLINFERKKFQMLAANFLYVGSNDMARYFLKRPSIAQNIEQHGKPIQQYKGQKSSVVLFGLSPSPEFVEIIGDNRSHDKAQSLGNVLFNKLAARIVNQ